MDAFAQVAAGQTGSLTEAALIFASDEYPRLDVPLYLERLQLMIDGFDLFRSSDDPTITLVELNHFFFDELEFNGNANKYFDPRNSYLNDVIDRKLGIPITLSVIYQMLARSAGLELVGINLPGHFLLAHEAETKTQYIDVFHRGAVLERHQLSPLILQATGQHIDIDSIDFSPMTNRQVLIRMLSNLKGIYSRSDLERCVRIQKRIVQLQPDSATELRDLGIMFFHAGKPHHAVTVLRDLMEVDPASADSEDIQYYFRKATKEAVLLN